MAKINPLFILIIGLAVAFVILLLSSSSGFIPYDNKSHYASYEPMTSSTTVSGNTTVSTLGVSNSFPVFTKQGGNTITSNKMSSNDSSVFGTENFEPIVDVPQTIQYGPLRDSEIIDRFSQVTANGIDGVDGCVSSGLSNSGGYICLTPDLIQMLKTRGGNAKGT